MSERIFVSTYRFGVVRRPPGGLGRLARLTAVILGLVHMLGFAGPALGASALDADPTEYAQLEQLFVSPQGSDANSGAADAPLGTISAALRLALDNRRAGSGTRINLAPGTYRESLVDRFDGRSGPLIVIEGEVPGETVITGSDVWTDWDCTGAACTHAWPHAWGSAPNPWPGLVEVGELARRREAVFVDGSPLRQVLSERDLTPGSFYVDEARGQLHVVPPTRVGIREQKVEVAVRPVLMRLQGLDNLVVRGITFQHAASNFREAAVDIVDQDDVLLEDVVVTWNGQTGVALKGSRLMVRDAEIVHNGSSGLTGYQTRDTTIIDTSTSYNNWRGLAGGYTSWEVGNKFLYTHRLTLVRHTSVGNASRGMWFDTDAVDVTISDSRFCENLTDGLFLEAVQGPFSVLDSRFCANGRYGIMTSATENLTLVGNKVEGNRISQLGLTGDFGTVIEDWETGDRHALENVNWTWRANVIVAPPESRLVTITYPPAARDTLFATSDFDENLYSAESTAAFTLEPGVDVGFQQWQAATQMESSSIFIGPLEGSTSR